MLRPALMRDSGCRFWNWHMWIQSQFQNPWSDSRGNTQHRNIDNAVVPGIDSCCFDINEHERATNAKVLKHGSVLSVRNVSFTSGSCRGEVDTF